MISSALWTRFRPLKPQRKRDSISEAERVGRREPASGIGQQ